MSNVFKPHLATDFYKIGHVMMYPKGMDFLYSNFTPRSTKWFPAPEEGSYDGNIVFVGLQGFLKSYTKLWNDEFFSKDIEDIINEYTTVVSEGMFIKPEEVYTAHIYSLHSLGFLPLLVRALKEGSVVPAKTPVFTIENTVSGFGWLVNYLETVFSNALWKPCVNATLAREYRNICERYAHVTSSPSEFVDWQCHDFSYRGLTCPEEGMSTGFAHLTSFKGTDTVPALLYARAYYGVEEGDIYGGSVYATEHAVACANITSEGGKDDDSSRFYGEVAWFKRYITEVVPKGIASYVADTYDFWGVLVNVLPVLKDTIMKRDGKLVLRPDSGDPVLIVTGYRTYGEDTPLYKNDVVGVNQVIYNQKVINDLDETYTSYEAIRLFNGTGYTYYHLSLVGDKYVIGDAMEECVAKGAVQVLFDLFGGTYTERGYAVLDSHIGLIYGDSITLDIAETILERLMSKGFASCNIVFGVGSFTYQYSTRDSLGFAMKATAMTLDGVVRPLQKDPKTGDGLKKSAKGRLGVHITEFGEYETLDNIPEDMYPIDGDALELTFLNGVMVRHQTLTDIRKNIK